MKKGLLIFIFIFIHHVIQAQLVDTIFYEDFNLVYTNININDYPFIQTADIRGEASVRTTRPSENYNNASASGNVFFNNNLSYISINNINVSMLSNIQLQFGLLKWGNNLDGSNFIVTIIKYGIINDTINFSPNLTTGVNTSHWRQITLPILTLNSVNKIDINISVNNYNNNSEEYRIDDIVILGERDIPLFNVFKMFKLNSEQQLEYELESHNYDYLAIEGSKNGKDFELFQKINQPSLKNRINIDLNEYKYYRLKVSLDHIEFTSTIKALLQNGKYYSYEGKQIIYNELQKNVFIYTIEGKILKIYSDAQSVDLSAYQNQVILVKDQYIVHKLMIH